MQKNRHATIYDIAAEAGVSIATVSRVLRGESTVAAATRERVEDAIRRHDYRPSGIARGLAGSATKTIGIVLPRLTNPYYAMLFTGAQEEARSNGYALSMFTLTSMSSGASDPAQLLTERRLDGAVMYVEYQPPDEKERLLASLQRLREYMPVVLTGCVRPDTDFPSVVLNHAELVQEIVRTLVSLGHERIAMIGGFREDTYPLRRDLGYMEGLREARLPFMESYRVFGRATPDCGRDGLNQILDGLRPAYWPTAVIAINDLVAMGCYDAAKARGLRIPQDLSVFGCDNLISAPYLTPALSSVDLSERAIGARAVQMAISGEQKHEYAPWKLVERQSCAAPGGTDQ